MSAPSPRAPRGLGGFLLDIGPLRTNSDFRRLWTGQLAATTGTQMGLVAVGYQTYRLTGSTAMVGLVSLGQLGPLLAGSLLGGPAVDAFDRRRVMLVTQVLLAVGIAGLAVNAMSGHPRLWPLFACTAESAAFQGVDWAARRASLRRLVSLAELGAALSLHSAAFQVTLVVGPAAAGLLIAHSGFALVYWLNVAGFGIAVASMARLPALPPGEGGERAGLASMVGGIRYLWSSQPLAGAFLIDLGAMTFGLPRALFPALAATVFGGGAATVGYLNAAPGVGALLGSLLTGRVGRVRWPGRAVTICVIAWGAAIAAFGLVRSLGVALVLLALAGAADVISSVFRMMIVQHATPDPLQGRVNSLMFAGLQGGPRLGDAEAGAAAAVAGAQFAAWSGGVLSAVTAVATGWLMPRFWSYRSDTGGGPGPADADRPGPADADRPGPGEGAGADQWSPAGLVPEPRPPTAGGGANGGAGDQEPPVVA